MGFLRQGDTTNDKNVTKKPFVSSLSEFFSIFLLTTVLNNNIDDEAARSIQFCQPI